MVSHTQGEVGVTTEASHGPIQSILTQVGKSPNSARGLEGLFLDVKARSEAGTNCYLVAGVRVNSLFQHKENEPPNQNRNGSYADLVERRRDGSLITWKSERNPQDPVRSEW